MYWYTFSTYMYKRRRQDPSRVREPVQVYLDRQDRELLEQLVESTGLPRTELIRRGLRALAAEKLVAQAPGRSMEELIGTFGDAPDVPADLSERHDTYLAQALEREHEQT
jgi:hypothetical protein